jgi:hypothetical protein
MGSDRQPTPSKAAGIKASGYRRVRLPLILRTVAEAVGNHDLRQSRI